MLLLSQVAPPPPPPEVKDTVVLVDDRATKDQVPPAFVERVIAELHKRKALKAVRISEARKGLDEREEKALTKCGDDAGCLAVAGREMGGSIVVFARLTKRDGAFFVAVTRVNALRPQLSDDAGTLAGTDADALAAIPEAMSDLFPEIELKQP